MSGKSRFVLVIILLLTDVVKHLTFEAKGGTSLRSTSFILLLFFMRYPITRVQMLLYKVDNTGLFRQLAVRGCRVQ